MFHTLLHTYVRYCWWAQLSEDVFLRVLCPVRWPITTLYCVLLKEKSMVFAAGLELEINSRTCLWLCVSFGKCEVEWTRRNITASFSNDKSHRASRNSAKPRRSLILHLWSLYRFRYMPYTRVSTCETHNLEVTVFFIIG